MSTDTLALIGSGLGGLLTIGIAMFGGFAWVVRRMDAMEQRLVVRMDAGDQRLATRMDAVDQRLATRIDAVDQRLATQMDAVDQRLDHRLDGLSTRFDGLEHELSDFRLVTEREFTELKVAVARIEGPRPRLIVER